MRGAGIRAYGGAVQLLDLPATEISDPRQLLIAVHAADGDTVSGGAPVLVVEAMKMEHTLAAPGDGILRLAVALGDRVSVGQVLATIEPPERSPSGGGTEPGVDKENSNP